MKKEMKHTALIDAITKVAEDKGWSVNVEEGTRWNNKTRQVESKGEVLEFTFAQYSDAGQDFSFMAEMKDGDVDTLIQSISEYYESYDPDEEASLWIGDDGHGKNGAPYRITDIVKDMEQCEEMVRDLLYAIEESNRKGEFDELEEEN